MLTGTLVLSGAEGPVNVSISAFRSMLWQVQTDAFGRYAESGLTMDVLVNGAVVFSFQVDALHPLLGPNQSAMLQAAAASIGLLLSGLAALTGVLKKRRRSVDQ